MEKEGKRIFLGLLFLALVLSLSSVSALVFNVKDSYLPGELLTAKIEGNLIDSISKSDIYFYRDGHVQVPARFDITSIIGEYNLYIVLPLIENNYTLVIKGLHYNKAGKEITEDIERNISVAGQPIFSVYPGFFLANKTLEINVDNFLESVLLLNVGIGETKQYTIRGGESQTIQLAVPEKAGLYSLKVSSERLSNNIPVWVYSSNHSEVKMPTKAFRFDPDKVTAKLTTEQTLKVYPRLYNYGDVNLTNLTLILSDSLSGKVSISPESLENFYQGLLELNLSLSSGNYSGTLKASAEGISSQLLIEVEQVVNESEVSYNDNYSPPPSEEKCSDIGKTCQDTEECVGEKQIVDGELCCLGECQSSSSSSSGYGWIIGIIILIGLAVGGFFLYKKYKKTKAGDKMQAVTRKFEQKYSPSTPASGSLSRF